MVDVVPEEQEDELAVEVAQVDVLQLDVEFAHVNDEVALEGDVEVELHVMLLQIVVDKVLGVEDVQIDSIVNKHDFHFDAFHINIIYVKLITLRVLHVATSTQPPSHILDQGRKVNK